MMDNLPNLNADELSAYASAKHLAGVPDEEIQQSIVQMLRSDGWKDAAITPMINEIARRTKEVAETKGSPRSPPKATQDATAAIMATLTQLTQMMAPITARLEALERRDPYPAPPAQTPESRSDPTALPSYLDKPQKRRLPDPERFDGNRSNYPGWKYDCEGKLEYDSHLYPTEDAKKRYILSRTKEKANQVLLPWILENRLGSVEELWEHMDTQFLDVHQQKRALNKLRHLKQGRRSVRDYVSEFNQLRVESGQEFSKSVLREMFSEGLTTELQRLMLRTPKHISFKEYTDEVIEMSDDLYRINLNNRTRDGSTRYAHRSHHQNHQNSARTPSPPENMDWEPTKVNKASAKDWRPNSDQIECYSCGKKGHIARNCDTGARARSTKVSRAAQRESSPACKCHAKAEGNSDSEESGKE
jgi:hypothetical protein